MIQRLSIVGGIVVLTGIGAYLFFAHGYDPHLNLDPNYSYVNGQYVPSGASCANQIQADAAVAPIQGQVDALTTQLNNVVAPLAYAASPNEQLNADQLASHSSNPGILQRVQGLEQQITSLNAQIRTTRASFGC